MGVDTATVQTLLDRATAARTTADDCTVVYEALCRHEAFGLPPFGWTHRRTLLTLVSDTAEGNAPLESLLGVVTAMIPAGWGWSIAQIGEKAGAMVCSPGQRADGVEWVESKRAHAALLRALLSCILAEANHAAAE